MIRLAFLFLFVLGLSAYAWRDWYRSLLGLIVMMAVIEHPDMPKNMLGVPGLNPWNLLFLNVLGGWLVARSRERRRFDLPRPIVVLLGIYLAVVLVGFARLIVDPAYLDYGPAGPVSEYLVNTLKWVMPGLMLFDGARTRRRVVEASVAVSAIYLLLAVQVIKWVPAGAALSGEEMSARALKLLMKEIGFHRVNLSMLLAGASWAIFALRSLATRGWMRIVIALLSIVAVYAQALTGGRTGYGTWVAIGLVLCLLRWRRYLLAVPVVMLLIVTLAPGVVERMSQGFVQKDPVFGEERTIDEAAITSDRTVIWPYVIAKIKERPLTGYGRQAMIRTGLTAFLGEMFDDPFPHPHNAYLEMLFDNGWIGMVLVMPFYLVVLGQSIVLFRDKRSPVFEAVGGASAALLLALLIAALGSQTFYPREGAVGMWCMFGLMWRVWVERRRATALVRAEARARRAEAPPPGALVPWPAAARTARPRRPDLDALLFARSA